MSRTQRSFLVAVAVAVAVAGVAVAVAAGAAGWGLGMLSAPASGNALRRRLARMTGQQWKTCSYSAARFVNNVAGRAVAEFARAKSLGGVRPA